MLDTLIAKPWVVYTKHCLNHKGTMVDCLARYTRRIAITNARLLKPDEAQVTLRVRDCRKRNRSKTLCLDREIFVRAFLLHVLPQGLMRIRHTVSWPIDVAGTSWRTCRRLTESGLERDSGSQLD